MAGGILRVAEEVGVRGTGRRYGSRAWAKWPEISIREVGLWFTLLGQVGFGRDAVGLCLFTFALARLGYIRLALSGVTLRHVRLGLAWLGRRARRGCGVHCGRAGAVGRPSCGRRGLGYLVRYFGQTLSASTTASPTTLSSGTSESPPSSPLLAAARSLRVTRKRSFPKCCGRPCPRQRQGVWVPSWLTVYPPRALKGVDKHPPRAINSRAKTLYL